MIRLLPYFIELVLVVFCLIDCVQADEHRIRNLPKWAWAALIVLLPVFGAIAWLVAGRPPRGSLPAPTTRPTGWPQYERPRPKAPDDDPDFLRSLKQRNAEQEELLRKWEEDLKRSEDEARKDEEKGSEEV
jgi:hypothetical protein